MSNVAIASAMRIARRYARGGAVNTNPSMAQRAAGNYKMRHITFQGLPITIENPKGTIRKGIDHTGKKWATRMTEDYGYIKGTNGHDGDHVDCFVGPDKKSDRVFVIDQIHNYDKDRFDEHKCMLGFNSKKKAFKAYKKSYGPDYGSRHEAAAMTEMSVDAFKEWLKGGGGKKPLAPDVPKMASGGKVKAGNTSMEDELYSRETEELADRIRNREYPPEALYSAKDLDVKRDLMIEHPDYYMTYSPRNPNYRLPGNPPWTFQSFQEGGSVDDPYTTPLDIEEKPAFEAWKQKYAPQDTGEDYDFPGAFKAGLTPDPQSGHWPDTFKKPNHPTFSVESQYAKDRPELAGHWNDDAYVPSGQVSDEDMARAQVAQQTAPREGGLMQTIPQAWEMVQTPEGRSKLWEAAKTEASQFIPGMIEQAKGPGEAMAGKMTPEQEAEWAAGMGLGMIGARSPFAEPGTVGIAGGRPTGKPGPEAVHQLSQNIAERIVEKHGDNLDAIQSTLDSLRQKTNDQVATAIYAKLPEDVQYQLAMRDMHPQLRERVEASAPPPFREITHPEEAKDWLREHGHDPDDWGYSDPENYVDLANKLKRQEMGLTPPPAPERLPVRTAPRQGAPELSPEITEMMGRDDVDQFFGQVSPHEVEHLPPEQVMGIRDKLSGLPDANDYKAQSPDLWNALHQRADEIEGRVSWAPEPPIRAAHDTFQSKFDEYLTPLYTGKKSPPDPYGWVQSPLDHFMHDYFGGMYMPGLIERRWEPYGGGFSFEGELRSPEGQRIGAISRSFSPEGKSAYHGYLKVDPNVRGTGMVPTMLKNQIDLYRKLGIERVKLTANIDVGGYAWARYGFAPAEQEWRMMKSRFKSHFDNGVLQADPTSNWGRHMLMEILNNSDPKAIWDLADLDVKEMRTGKKIGQALLMNKSWGGVLNLTDGEALARFYDYVATKAQKKQQP